MVGIQGPCPSGHSVCLPVRLLVYLSVVYNKRADVWPCVCVYTCDVYAFVPVSHGKRQEAKN